MLITAAPLIDIAPIERATMANRVVVQYDKRDVETIKLIKLDLLGLGMLAAIDEALMLIQRDCAVCLDLDRLPEEIPEVFEMLQAADTVGVFQVESRAQMQTLPKSRPTCLDDLVVEVAIIRPGPIQGNAVHPYLRRKQGLEPVTYLHPQLEPILAETLGVILYQEQVMEIAIQVGGFTPAESDGFRRAMGTWRSSKEMEKLHRKFSDGCLANGMTRGGRRGAVPAGLGVRVVRVREVARGGVRPDRLRVVVPEAVLPRAPHGRADQRAADGLLPGRGADQRCEAPRRRDPAGGRERVGLPDDDRVGRACPGGRCPMGSEEDPLPRGRRHRPTAGPGPFARVRDAVTRGARQMGAGLGGGVRDPARAPSREGDRRGARGAAGPRAGAGAVHVARGRRDPDRAARRGDRAADPSGGARFAGGAAAGAALAVARGDRRGPRPDRRASRRAARRRGRSAPPGGRWTCGCRPPTPRLCRR